jgi:CRP-like cAMP-binding protein
MCDAMLGELRVNVAGDFVGGEGLFTGRKRPQDVVALEEGTMALLVYSDVPKIQERSPELAHHLLSAAARAASEAGEESSSLEASFEEASSRSLGDEVSGEVTS